MSADLGRILPALYDAALSPERWPNALDAFASGVGAMSSILVAVDQVGLPFQIQQSASTFEIERVQYYFQTFGHHDEPLMSARLAQAPPLKVLKDFEVWGDMSALEDRPDYRWLRENYGVRRRAGVRLSEKKGWTDLLALQFGHDWPDVDSSSDANLGVLLPHLAKVVEVNRTFFILRERFSAALAALDHICIGACVVTATGFIAVANKEAERILNQRDGISRSGAGTINLLTHELTSELREKVRMVAATAGGKNDAIEQLVLGMRKSDARPLLIEVKPLRDADGEIDRSITGALLFIVDPENSREIDVSRLSKLHRLTQSEASVCKGLVEGKSATEIARERGVTLDTVKTQIKSMYLKAGVSRRAELVRLAIVVDPPIDRA